MQIIPTTEIVLFPDVGLSPDSSDTRFFASVAEKDSFFNSVTGKTSVTGCTIVRDTENRIRIEKPYRDCINKQYCRWRNPDVLSGKWFYGFITDVKYINAVTTEIGYSIDYVMSYMGAFTLEKCYIERYTPLANEQIGDNLLSEPVSIGDYVEAGTIPIQLTDYSVVIEHTIRDDSTSQSGDLYNGIFTGSKRKVVPLSQITELKGWIEDIVYGTNSVDGIVSMQIVPTQCIQQNPDNEPGVYYSTYAQQYAVNNVPEVFRDNYRPRNKKLYTYPYNLFTVDNSEGTFVEYRYEDFASGNPAFMLNGSYNGTVQLLLSPVNYKGRFTPGSQSEDSLISFEQGLSMSNFPLCSWNSDTFKAYLAQKASYGGVNQFIDIASKTTMSAMLNPGSGIATLGESIFNAIIKDMQDENEFSHKPALLHGATSSNILHSIHRKRYTVTAKQIRPEYAKVIDDFFTIFGYAYKRVEIPNMNRRTGYTYIKTIGCIVHCNAPALFCREIEKRFDNGIRLWTSGTTIGNYDSNY